MNHDGLGTTSTPLTLWSIAPAVPDRQATCLNNQVELLIKFHIDWAKATQRPSALSRFTGFTKGGVGWVTLGSAR